MHRTFCLVGNPTAVQLQCANITRHFHIGSGVHVVTSLPSNSKCSLRVVCESYVRDAHTFHTEVSWSEVSWIQSTIYMLLTSTGVSCRLLISLRNGTSVSIAKKPRYLSCKGHSACIPPCIQTHHYIQSCSIAGTAYPRPCACHHVAVRSAIVISFASLSTSAIDLQLRIVQSQIVQLSGKFCFYLSWIRVLLQDRCVFRIITVVYVYVMLHSAW